MRATEAKKLFMESNKYVPHFQRLTEVIKTISMSGGTVCCWEISTRNVV